MEFCQLYLAFFHRFLQNVERTGYNFYSNLNFGSLRWMLICILLYVYYISVSLLQLISFNILKTPVAIFFFYIVFFTNYAKRTFIGIVIIGISLYYNEKFKDIDISSLSFMITSKKRKIFLQGSHKDLNKQDTNNGKHTSSRKNPHAGHWCKHFH